MALDTVFSSSSIFPSHYSRPRLKSRRANILPLPVAPAKLSVSCRIPNPGFSDDDLCDAEQKKKCDKALFFSLVSVPVTLTIISTSLPQPAQAAPSKVSGKKRAAKKSPEALTPEQLKSWSKGLPLVTDRIPYTDVLELKREGRLKHVIKATEASLRRRVEPALVVLEDSRVARTVLPSLEGNSRFWQMWDELDIDSLCVNAYTPLKKPEVPVPYLGFLSRVPEFVLKWMKPQESKRASGAKRMREEFKKKKNEELARLKKEREMTENARKAQKKEEERRRKMEMKKSEDTYKESSLEPKKNNPPKTLVWITLAQQDGFTTLLGVVFFVIFYRTVVLNYRKQQKDYEDRLKIAEADAEEKRKIKELEMELEGVDGETEIEGGEENPYAKMASQFMKSGARVKRVQNRRIPQYLEKDVDVKFTDVAGLGKIRLELEEIVKFFTHAEMYRRKGIKIPGGILLCGPPGVGKTLLAKAVAGEAGVNFFSISASQFVEIYVGVGASRVRALYQEARENAPSVVFIDELDAVGRERGSIKGSGGKERDATLNQLLVSLDGFEGRGEVITIASTNRPDILDPALVRPGRFDRKIFIPRPGKIGRVEILKVHARKKSMAEDVDYFAVADATDGMVGAELANIIEVAAINMMRDGRTAITTDDLLQAAEMEERGLLERKDMSSDAWRQMALNEAAGAVVAVNFPDLKNIEFITISPRAGSELGYARMKMDHMKLNAGLVSRQSLLDYITVQLAPRAAEELLYGEGQLSTIWADTANNARLAARRFIFTGLSEKHYGLNNFWVADQIDEVDSEALRILTLCYDRAKEILQENRNLLNAVIEELAEKKSLTKQEFFHLVELHGSLKPMPPSIMEIRAAKLKQFQEKMLMLQNREEAVVGEPV